MKVENTVSGGGPLTIAVFGMRTRSLRDVRGLTAQGQYTIPMFLAREIRVALLKLQYHC